MQIWPGIFKSEGVASSIYHSAVLLEQQLYEGDNIMYTILFITEIEVIVDHLGHRRAILRMHGILVQRCSSTNITYCTVYPPAQALHTVAQTTPVNILRTALVMGAVTLGFSHFDRCQHR